MKGLVKIVMLLLLIALQLNIALAAETQVYILHFNYDNKIITFIGKTIKEGYYPDMKIQPDNSYRLEIISTADALLYSAKFDIPLKVHTDILDEDTGNIDGSLIVLNQTNFALIVPYFEDAKEIVIYNPNDFRISSIGMEQKLSPARRSLIFLVPVVFVLILLLVLRIIKKRK